MRCSTECGCCNYGPSPSSGSAGWLGCAMNIRPAHACNRCRCRVLNASASAATHNHPHPSPRFGMTALFCLRLLILVIAVATQPYPDSVSGSNGEENSFRVDIDSASFRAVPLHEDKDFSCPSPPIEQRCLLLALRLCSRCVSAFFSTFSFLSAQTLARLPALWAAPSPACSRHPAGLCYIKLAFDSTFTCCGLQLLRPLLPAA